MPLRSEMVGQSTAPTTVDIDARWIMAYSAGIGDNNQLYMDTRGKPVVAHPVFPVCFEWPV